MTGSVVDGSVWTGADFDAFYRFLDQAPDVSPSNVAVTGALPLLQQPDVYRNQRVRIVGQIAKAERLSAEPNAFGIQDYWQLWVRPSGGADRPVVLIVPHVPQAIASLDPRQTEGPAVNAVGRFLKRWAYRSQLGADLAPVVVGRLLEPPQPVVVSSSPGLVGAGDQRLWVILALAALGGGGLAILAMWRTQLAAQRTRAIRSSHRGARTETFLRQLDGQLSEGEGDDNVP